MKIVMLVDGTEENFEDMIDAVGTRPSLFIDTGHCDETHECRYLTDSIGLFSQSESEVMLAKFSGKESIIKDLGDERPEMILTLSDKRNSKYYTECPRDTLLDLFNIFEQEIVDGIRA